MIPDLHAPFRAPASKKFRLKNAPTRVSAPFTDKHEARKFTAECLAKIEHLQYRLFVEQKQSLLIVLQAPDAAGKDGVIRKVLGQMNPQGCAVHSFKVPTELERSHDFLWRIHARVPAAGQIAIFNRSHYEDVLVVRVNKLVAPEVWQPRFDYINHFEANLSAAGTHIVKIFLHISREEQLQRFKERLDNPESHWKLNPGDYTARNQHEEYAKAYEEIFVRCNSDSAPWYVIPADQKWFRDAAVASLLLATLSEMNPQLPPVTVDLQAIRDLYENELASLNGNSSR